MTTLSWKFKEDLCRCCHAEGKFHRLSDPCRFMAQNEVYTEMLKTTLDLEIRPVVGALEASTFTICEPCILRLRDAHNFRQQVLDCEASFRDMYNSFMKENDTPVEIKEELPESYEDVKKEYNQTDDDCHDGFEVKFDDSADDEPLLKKLLIGYTDTKKPKSKIKSKTKKIPKSSKKNEKEVNDKNPSGTVEGEVATVEKKRRAETKPCKFYMKPSDYRREGDDMYCSFCDKKYNRMTSLRFHVKYNHYKVDRYFCKICDKGFLTAAPLTRHKLEAHNVDDRFKCKACDAVFNTSTQLRKHINNFHLLGQKYKCESCEYESFSFESLYKHKVKHKTVKDHHCKFCRKSFLRKATLDLHERIHTGDRRKVCQVCSQAFVQKASLNYHMTKYHPEVNF